VLCACCGQSHDDVVALQCHDDIKVCRGCIEWLRQQAGALDVTPTLPVSDMDVATAFYEAAGFHVRRYDDGFAFVDYADTSVFDLDLAPGIDPDRNGAGCYIITPDADAWHARLTATGLPVTPIEDQPWGMHEFTLSDPSGNSIRIGRSTSSGSATP
jgi:catechol 2,3-dioxygenase-like lactoylglutathione lyase family enzyme